MNSYCICTRCVMDLSDPEIEFDTSGLCNHCRNYENVISKTFLFEDEANEKLYHLVEKIRASRKNNEYDCVMGVSGGVDSSYMAYLTKKLGLRPLVIHVDNGWNAELASENINNIVDKLGFKLHTYNINWEEFKDLQRSFLKASVIDIEMITDHAIAAVLIKEARKNNIKYILGGSNVATESGIPKAWSWLKSDLTNIKSIHRRFGTRKLITFPSFGYWQYLINKYITKNFMYVYPLNYVGYNKSKAMEVLTSKLGWQYYGGKHYESIFTKFYQAYILPEKFGIDKRKAHFSSLIHNGEMTREEALEELKKPPYDPDELMRDKEFVLKKLGFTEKEFEEIMNLPIKSHMVYPSDLMIIKPTLPIFMMIREHITKK